MPYKDPEKQRESNRKSVQKYLDKQRALRLSRKDKAERLALVSDLYFKGNSVKDIAQKLAIPELESRRYVNQVRKSLQKQAQNLIVLERAKLLKKIDMVEKKLWELMGDATEKRFKMNTVAKLTPLFELRAKVLGIMGDKSNLDNYEKRANTLLEELAKLERQSKKDSSIEVKEIKDEIPEFLKGEQDARPKND